MPILLKTSPQNLKVGKKYFVDVRWNLTNNLRVDNHYTFIGIYKDSSYVRGRTHSFDSGLQVLLAPSRYEVKFEVDGLHQKISSSNAFYEIVNPPERQIASISCLFKLKLPIELKKYISSYLFPSRLLLPYHSFTYSNLQYKNLMKNLMKKYQNKNDT